MGISLKKKQNNNALACCRRDYREDDYGYGRHRDVGRDDVYGNPRRGDSYLDYDRDYDRDRDRDYDPYDRDYPDPYKV